MLDFRTETFLTVCEYMNYTKAAEILNMTQPAISNHIHYLENYYGTKLFTYNNKKLSLTAQGKHLQKALQTLVHDELKLKNDLSKINPVKKYQYESSSNCRQRQKNIQDNWYSDLISEQEILSVQ